MDTGLLGNPGKDQLPFLSSKPTCLSEVLLSSSSHYDSTSSCSESSPLDSVPLNEPVFLPPPPSIPSPVANEGSSVTLHKDTREDESEKEVANVKKRQLEEEQLPLSKKRKDSQYFDVSSSAPLIQGQDIEQTQLEPNQQLIHSNEPQNTEQSHITEQPQGSDGPHVSQHSDGPHVSQHSDVSLVKQPAEASSNYIFF